MRKMDNISIFLFKKEPGNDSSTDVFSYTHKGDDEVFVVFQLNFKKIQVFSFYNFWLLFIIFLNECRIT